MKTYHLITAIIGTLLVALAVWVGLIWGAMWLGKQAYERGDYDSAAQYYKTAERVSPLDRWRPDFGQGTALLANGDTNRGITKLEEALTTVPQAEVVDGVKDPGSYECLVRANLYLGYAEAERNDEAEAIIETCPNPDPSATSGGQQGNDPNGPDTDGPDPNGGTGTEEPDEPTDPKIDELGQRNREADQQRQQEQEWGSNTGGAGGESW